MHLQWAVFDFPLAYDYDLWLSACGRATVRMVECNNLTLINLILRVTGPMREDSLTLVLLGDQVACSLLTFAIRNPLAYLLYGEIVA